MIKITFQYYLLTFCWLLIGIKCQMQKESDERDEDGFIKHFSITSNPDDFQRDNRIPLRMGIWMGVVLGIFVLMAVGVCCGLFCKYSGKMATSEVAPPIPIVVTPPSRTPTVGSFSESGFTNHGYSGNGSEQNETQRCASSATPPGSPTRDVLPMYTDLARSNEMNASFKRIVKGTLETPPPFYITVSPFK